MQKSLFKSFWIPLVAGIALWGTAMFLSAGNYKASLSGISSWSKWSFVTQSFKGWVQDEENWPLADIRNLQKETLEAQKEEALAVEEWKATHPNAANDAWVFTTCSDQTEVTQAECQALVDLYTATNGEGWARHDKWLQSSRPCEWYGVECTSNGQWRLTVAHLNLFENNLRGNLPISLGDLSNLRTLLLTDNKLSGALPISLGSLSKLKQLNLGKNAFEGALPDSLGNLRELNGLFLYDNQLSGPIPSSFGNLIKLYTLDLSSNQLNGTIPATLGSLNSLANMALLGNQLSGPIPTTFGNLVNLQQLALDYNQLSGPIPSSLGNLRDVKQMSFEYNSLCGSVPDTFMQNQNIKLWVDNNKLLTTGYSQEMTSWLNSHLWSRMPPNGWGVQESEKCSAK